MKYRWNVMKTSKLGMAAISEAAERDAGLGRLGQTRAALGTKKLNQFSDLTSDSVLQHDLQTTYGSIDNVDLFIGGLAENHLANARLCETFRTIINKQF